MANSKILDFKHDIQVTEEHTRQLAVEVETVDKDLKIIHADLQISEDINKKLHTLDTTLDRTSQLLTLVSIVPAISEEALKLKKKIDEFHKPIIKAKETSDKVEAKVKPIREDIKNEYIPKAERTDEVLLETVNVETMTIEALNTAYNCITSPPKSNLKLTLEKQMNNVCAGLDPEILTFDKVQVILISNTKPIVTTVDDVITKIHELNQINIAIDNVLNILNPLVVSLESLYSVFSKKIEVPYMVVPKICSKGKGKLKIYYPCGTKTLYKTFSIEQILNGISGVTQPIMNLILEAMNRVLDPILRKLHLDIDLPEIQGLDILQGFDVYIEQALNKIKLYLIDLENKIALFKDFMVKLKNIKFDGVSKISLVPFNDAHYFINNTVSFENNSKALLFMNSQELDEYIGVAYLGGPGSYIEPAQLDFVNNNIGAIMVKRGYESKAILINTCEICAQKLLIDYSIDVEGTSMFSSNKLALINIPKNLEITQVEFVCGNESEVYEVAELELN